ncbi:hypothetical protein [Hoeflea sp.]|uniref:hypothetical protein n=1 Tax=Hoeflea sp. TaxID=1940281 RepID=UPI0019A93DF5|nr:hypothetical protein [Hoeflea sp.]MBC7280040.1 hypothetical protein [Hoeflea sp.]
MSIVFPRELPEGIEFRHKPLRLVRGVAAARSGNRVVNHSQVADPFWVAELTTMPLRYPDRMKVEAWYYSLRDGLRKTFYRHPEACYPAAHPGDGGVANNDGNLVSVANGNELTVDSVDVGLVLGVGDYAGLRNGTKWALGVITEVSGAGTSRVIAIEPEPPVDVAVSGAVVRFVKPPLVMKPVPDSLSSSETATGFWAVSFTLQESR